MAVKIILAGAGPFVLPVFNEILGGPLEIVAVVTQPDAPKDRGKKLKSQEVADAAEAAGIPVIKPKDINVIVEELQCYGADLLLTASYGQFVKRCVRDAFPHKSYNLHPSLLPLYRGATPVNEALKDGQTETGVTLYRMESAMDAGPIAAQTRSPVNSYEKADELLLRLATVAGILANNTLPKVVAGEINLQEQDHSQATHCRKMTKADAKIDWSQTATQIHNRLRAQTPWPGSYCTYNGNRLSLYDSEITTGKGQPGEILKASKSGVTVACSKGAITFKGFQLPGKKRLDAAAFLNGQALKPGYMLT